MTPSRLPDHLSDDTGASIVEDLLALMLLALVFAVGVQAFMYAQARSVAIAAAQDGARTAANDGPDAGISQADRVIQAGGRLAQHLNPTVGEDTDTVTITVTGQAPGVFPLSILLPAIHTSATVPLESYPADEQAANK